MYTCMYVCSYTMAERDFADLNIQSDPRAACTSVVGDGVSANPKQQWYK